MALATVTKIGDGVTNTWSVEFAMGYVSPDDITCQVNNEVDGANNPVYRDITILTNVLFQISGSVPAAGHEVVFRRTVSETERRVDWERASVVTELNLDTSDLQIWHKLHELLDGETERNEAIEDVVERQEQIDADHAQIVAQANA